MEKENIKDKRIGYYLLLLVIPLIIYFSFGFYHLSKFETADEHFWLYDSIEGRIHDYWRAVSSHNWKATRINDKPGITLAYVSGLGILMEKNQENRLDAPGEFYQTYNPAITEQINFSFRLPQLIFIGLFSFFFFWIIRKLTKNGWLSLLSVSLLLLNPILLGISQIINPDALLWVFSFSSLICFLVYIRDEKRIDGILSSVLLGLALLSKYSAVIFFPFLFVVMVAYLFWNYESWDRGELKRKTKNLALSYMAIILGALVLFSILMPAVFSSFAFFYKGTIGFKGMQPIFWSIVSFDILLYLDAQFSKSSRIFQIFEKIKFLRKYLPRVIFGVIVIMFLLIFINYSFADNFLNIKGVAFDASQSDEFQKQNLYDKIFLEIYPIVFSLTPLVLISLFYIWIRSIFKKSSFGFLIFVLSLFFIVFYAAVLVQGLLVNIRYSVMLYPFTAFLAAIAIFEFFNWERVKNSYRIILFLAIIAASSVSLYLIKPFYFNYMSEFLPKERIVTGAWGYGGYEAAQYLNSLPNSENLIVWSDYWGFCPFFKGKCVKSTELNGLLEQKKEMLVNYFVVTRRGGLGANKRAARLAKEIMENAPVWKLEIDGRPKNYIYIYKKDIN